MNFHYESTWQEMRLLVEAGLSPTEVIQMATLGNARLFGAADDLGSVEPGKFADLIIVDGNPLVEMSALHRANVVHVLKGGELVR
jgi:imidazolonepropionase-like amidohydrolase